MAFTNEIQKVLLLNPGFNNSLIIKDQYCSFTSKAGYYWIPVDLLVLSGSLKENFEIKVIDAIVEGKDSNVITNEILEFKPDAVICLSSLITHNQDRELINELKQQLKFHACFIGDIFYFQPQIMISYPEVDSILYEFPADDLIQFFQTGVAQANILYKDETGIIKTPRVKNKEIKYSTPAHEDFPLKKYTVPFMKSEVCASIFTNFGCKFQCSYCPASAVSYRERTVNDIKDELNYLKTRNIDNLWVRDFTFGLNYKLTKEVLSVLEQENFKWFCSSRAEVLKPDLIKSMASSGCYLMAIGIDMISEESNKRVNRNQKNHVIKKTLKEVSNNNIRVLVHLLLAAPGETYLDMLKSIHFVSFSSATFLSINFFSPRAGSKYFQDDSIQSNSQEVLDSYHSNTFFLNLIKFYALCIFYFNPIRIFHILNMISSKKELFRMLKTGVNLFLPNTIK